MHLFNLKAIGQAHVVQDITSALAFRGDRFDLQLSFALADLRAPVTADVNKSLLAEGASSDFFLFSYVCRESQACSHELLPELLKRAKIGACFLFLDQFTGDIDEVRHLADRVAQEMTAQVRFDTAPLGGARDCPFNGIAVWKNAKGAGEP